MKKPLLILAGLLVLFAALSVKAKPRGARIVYEKPSPILSGSSMAVMIPAKRSHSAKAETYRFAAAIETTPGKGCEYDTTLIFRRSYINSEGLWAGEPIEIKIHREGSTVTSTAEIAETTFRVKAGTLISYAVDYMIGGRCKVRPTYQVFPVLEQMR